MFPVNNQSSQYVTRFNEHAEGASFKKSRRRIFQEEHTNLSWIEAIHIHINLDTTDSQEIHNILAMAKSLGRQ
uniref:Uncharacterized protein n=1 Tax=Setaria italica TaxID=4555 RepID=K3Y0L6_SETIT